LTNVTVVLTCDARAFFL